MSGFHRDDEENYRKQAMIAAKDLCYGNEVIEKIKAAKNPKFPSSSTIFTGSLPQYAYRFNPIILDESRYSIESGVINLNNTGL